MPFFPMFGGGLAALGKAVVSGSTGATVDSATRSPRAIYKFTGSGTITVSTAGTCEILVVGGGGGGGSNVTDGAAGGGAGAGAYLYIRRRFSLLER